MMGRLAALLLLMAGCTDGVAPPVLVQDLGINVTGPADLSGVGASCMTACDCTAGLACVQMQCAPMSATAPSYCCGTVTCPGDSLCQFTDGTVSQCSRADDGGIPIDVDAGATPIACSNTLCTRGPGGDALCQLACGASSATCIKTGGIEHCKP